MLENEATENDADFAEGVVFKTAKTWSFEMFKTNNDLYRDAIEKTIANHAGKSPDSSAIADAAVITWLEMCAQLKPVLGVRGVNILFRRSLHLAKISFPEIEISDFNENDTNLLAGLKNNLTRREATDALESICDLLVTFTELLATLIGESLTKRLLVNAWVLRSPMNKENRS